MREKIYDHVRILLEEEDFEIIKQRFNYRNFKRKKDCDDESCYKIKYIKDDYFFDEYFFCKECPLCKKYFINNMNLCHLCPFDPFHITSYDDIGSSKVGCLALMHRLLNIPLELDLEFYVLRDRIGYHKKKGEKNCEIIAKKQLDQILDFLKSFKKI